MTAVATRVLAVASLALILACGGGGGDNPMHPTTQDQFTANVSGATTKSMNGSAGFVVSSGLFSLTLANASNDGTYIQLSRAGVPGAGTYAVKGSDAKVGDFMALFAGGGTSNYVGTGGTVTISASGADRVTGTFNFTAAGGSSGTATVTISGSFDAKRITMP